jgi:DNA-binding NarL/FixJ family response regulator
MEAAHFSILIIDDNQTFLKAISEFIQDQCAGQIRILATAHNGSDGAILAAQLHPNVILLDLLMPEMHGFKVIPILRQALPGVKIIATTLLSSDDYELYQEIYVQESLKAGADASIPKFRLNKDLVPAVLATP